jgi:hypothetical protein
MGTKIAVSLAQVKPLKRAAIAAQPPDFGHAALPAQTGDPLTTAGATAGNRRLLDARFRGHKMDEALHRYGLDSVQKRAMHELVSRPAPGRLTAPGFICTRAQALCKEKIG